MQNAKPTGTQQITDDDRQLDAHFFQQTLHLVLQSYSVARELHLHAGEAAPNTLFPVGHKTQYQLIGDQPPQQPRVLKASLPPARSTVGEPLRQLQTHMGLQPQPHRPPVLSGRFHDCLLHPCSCNQIRHRCNSLGSVTNRRRAGFSSGTLASTTTTIKTFLCTSIPAIFIASSWRGSGRTHAKSATYRAAPTL